MAKNGLKGDNRRVGMINNRSQTKNTLTNKWIKRDTTTGKFIDAKSDDKPFVGVRKEK